MWLNALKGEAANDAGSPGLEYGWYLAADSGLRGGLGYAAAAAAARCRAADDERNVWWLSKGMEADVAVAVALSAAVARLVCVLRCCRSSSDVENLLPQYESPAIQLHTYGRPSWCV